MADPSLRKGSRARGTGRARAAGNEPGPTDPERSDRAPTIDWRRTVRSRVFVMAAGLGLWAVGIEARLIVLQIVQHNTLVARAERQQLRTITAPAKRGEILDRAGRVLAFSVDADSIYAVPTEIHDPERTVAQLCGALGNCSEKARARLVSRLNSRRAFAYVRRKVSPRQARQVAALRLKGIEFLKENQRFYPNRKLAAHLLGYVGIDNQGLHGIEFTYDSQIRGRPGKILVQTDGRPQAFSRLERPPTAGATIELTIDEYLQHIVERELHAAIRAHGASGGTIIMLDPHTGEVLALANEPTFNPNAFARSKAADRRNRAVQDIYEPGSTFKIVTASAALEDHLVVPDDLIDVSAGMIRFGSREVNDASRHGTLSFTDVIVKSSNVGAIKIGLKVGADRLGRYARRFGFGQTLSRDFQGESSGIVWNPSRLDDSALASMAMGYQVGVTPLQMVAAVSAIADGGELIEPRVVRAVVRNGQRVETARRVIRRAVSRETAATLTGIMEEVVRRGTGRKARLPGYTIAGKTGTSAKLVNGRYSKTEYNASFVGFVPSRDPVLAALVVIDSPRGRHYFGGAVAAPVFRRVGEAALRHLGVPPTIHPALPIVVRREPTPRPARTATIRPTVIPTTVPLRPGQLLMPDLRGQSARQAVRTLAALSLGVRFTGNGFVTDQRPSPGSTVDRGAECLLRLRRHARADETGKAAP